jgi:hypothetical protein
MQASMKLLASLFALAFACVAAGCSHTVNMTSEPAGAEVYLDGTKIGTTPFAYEEKSGSPGQVELVAKQGGKEKKVTVPRSTISPMGIGVGAGGGAAACVALNLAGCALGFIPYVGFVSWTLNCAGCLMLPAGAGAGWYFMGNTMPDAVKIEMKDAEPAAAASPGAPPPSAAY